MRQLLSAATVTALFALAIPSAAFAEEEREAASTEASTEGSSETHSSQSAFKHKGALLDASPQTRHQQLSGFAFIPWNWGFGIGLGARYDIPIVPDGFIPMLNDSFELEFGADFWTATWGGFGYSYTYFGLAAPVAEAMWNFHITDRFSAYWKVGLGWSFAFYSGSFATYANGYNGGFYWNSGPGVFYRFSDSLSVRGELSYQGARVGIALAL